MDPTKGWEGIFSLDDEGTEFEYAYKRIFGLAEKYRVLCCDRPHKLQVIFRTITAVSTFGNKTKVRDNSARLWADCCGTRIFFFLNQQSEYRVFSKMICWLAGWLAGSRLVDSL